MGRPVKLDFRKTVAPNNLVRFRDRRVLGVWTNGSQSRWLSTMTLDMEGRSLAALLELR